MTTPRVPARAALLSSLIALTAALSACKQDAAGPQGGPGGGAMPPMEVTVAEIGLAKTNPHQDLIRVELND